MALIKTTKESAHKEWKRWKKENSCAYINLLSYCSKCHTEEHLGIHHIDGDRRNNNPDNLTALCWPCHKQEHMNNRVKYEQDDELKGGKLSIRMHPDMYEWLEHEAVKEHLSTAAFIKYLILKEQRK